MAKKKKKGLISGTLGLVSSIGKTRSKKKRKKRRKKKSSW